MIIIFDCCFLHSLNYFYSMLLNFDTQSIPHLPHNTLIVKNCVWRLIRIENPNIYRNTITTIFKLQTINYFYILNDKIKFIFI